MKIDRYLLLRCLFVLTLLSILYQCNKKEEDNSLAVFPKFNISPKSGTIQTLFTFDSTPTTWNGYTQGVQFQFNYDWDFGDGTTKLNASNIETHQYANTNTYKVTLKMSITNQSTGEYVEGSSSDNVTVE